MNFLHKSLLEKIKEIDRVCRLYNIKYSLHGGTLLGAVRNKGFIPWDDDLDITMTRENYNKFVSKFPITSEKYTIDVYNTWLPRVVDKNKNMQEITFVDIFIYDSISEKKIFQKIRIFFLRFLQGTLKYNVDYSKFTIKEKIFLFTTRVLGGVFSRNFKLKVFDYISRNLCKGDNTLIHRSNDSYKGVGIILDKSTMKNYIDIKFENTNLMITKDYKKILTSSYGEKYMIPPPLKERVPMHEKQRKNYYQELNKKVMK
ncbi:LicD family protein [Eubacterium callanderi]|uniref:LicD family protein n=1 Tax=Eubacterium callanderi TaxID=53442 RepID=UPI0022E7EBE7|nr:LicD family protein [Eubacterium callanderi]